MANYLDETGLARVWGKVKGLFTKSNVENALGYTINKSVPSDAAFTDANVTQTATDGSSNAEYEILFSGTADNTTRTEGTKKTSRFTFNPQTNQVTAGHFTAESTSPSGTITATLQGNDVKLGGTSNTWDGTNTSLKTSISGIKQSLSYKYIETKTGTGTVSFPSTTKELYIMVSWKNDIQYAYPFHIAITGNGYFMVGGGYGDAVIYISTTNHTVNINTVTYNGTNVSANAKMAVYYR